MIFQNFGFNRVIPRPAAVSPADPDLIIWVDAADAASYTSGSTTVYDLSGNGNNLTVSGTIAFESVTGSWGFDNNTSNYISTTNLTGLDVGTGPASYEIWQKYMGPQDDNYYVFFENGANRAASGTNESALGFWPDSGFGYGLTVGYGTSNLAYYVPPFNVTKNYTKSNSKGLWRQVVLVRDGDTAYFYVNGTQEATRNGFSARDLTNPEQLIIGSRYSTNLNAYTGSIAIFKAWDKALTSTEVSASYAANKARFGL
jgi:hypothetical protein